MLSNVFRVSLLFYGQGKEGSCYVDQTDLGLMNFLPQAPKRWGYNSAQWYLTWESGVSSIKFIFLSDFSGSVFRVLHSYDFNLVLMFFIPRPGRQKGWLSSQMTRVDKCPCSLKFAVHSCFSLTARVLVGHKFSILHKHSDTFNLCCPHLKVT